MLEWSLQHTYDWRAGLHAAGSLIMYEELSPALTMTCPALLMRNTTDDPTWTSSIYHDRVWWFFRRQLSGGKALQPALRKALSCLDHALAKIMNLLPKDFREFGVGSFVYAALFLTEGIGLWLAKPWAEWFTIIITGSLFRSSFMRFITIPQWPRWSCFFSM